MKFANTYTKELMSALSYTTMKQNSNNETYQKYRAEFNKILDSAIEKMVNNDYNKPKYKVFIKK